MDTTWKVRDVDGATVGRLAGALGLRQVTARCLLARGIADPDKARTYLSPKLGALRKPEGLAGFQQAVERIAAAVRNNERIGVFGDYDVDGVTTAALMTGFLRQLGSSVVARVARRDAGYGFGVSDADFFASSGCSLLITGDCGTSDVDAIERAGARGVDVIVVDHHTVPDRAEAHPALALINPFRADSTFPFRGMASVGLSFYLMAGLRTELRRARYFESRREPDPRDYLDLVALGTVADLVPLQGENRILTAIGIRYLTQRRRPGVAALLRVAGVEAGRAVDEHVIAWKLGPRLNAPGRLGDAEPALSLLLAEDRASATRWADRLETANQARREAQSRVFEEALSLLGERDPGPCVVVAKPGWASGVVGIVAAKLVDIYQRPAFVIALPEQPADSAEPGDDAGSVTFGRGSARTPDGFDLYRALAACDSLLERFGGHASAAGLTVRSDRLEVLTEALGRAIEQQRANANAKPSARFDAEVGLGDVDVRLCRELESLGPFGNGNEKPLLLCRGMRVRQSRRVGDGSHLKLEVEDHTGVARSGIGFGLGERDPGRGATIDAAFAPMINEWQGRTRVELEIRQLSKD